MIQQPKLCGQRWKLSVGAKIQSRKCREQSSEHLLLSLWWRCTEGMVTHDAVSAAHEVLQTLHRHPLYLPDASGVMKRGTTCFIDKAGSPLKHHLYFLIQTVRPHQPLSSSCQRCDSTQGRE